MAVKGAIVEGMDFVKGQLTGFLPRESTAILRRATTRIAARIRNDMRANAPRRDGTLRRAIVSKRRRGSKNSIEAAVFITRGKGAKNDAFYWYFVEYGTKSTQAEPFAGPAIERAQSSYREDIAAEVRRQVIRQLELRAKRQKVSK